jgi:probable HAF family extracellular repeat protein
MAIDLGVWPGGHYSVANGINNLGQIVGTGTVAGDNLDHALMWTVDEGGGIPCGDLVSFQARCRSNGSAHKLQAKLTLTNTSHSGEQVTITVDGNPTLVTINGNQAQLSINNPALGQHTIVLTDPAGCFPPRMPSCE